MKIEKIKMEKYIKIVLLDSDYIPIKYANDYFELLHRLGMSQNTIITYSYAIRDFYCFLEKKGCTLTEAIDSEHPLDFLNEYCDFLDNLREKGLSDVTLNYKIKCTFRYWNYLLTNKIVDKTSFFIEEPNRNQYSFKKEFLPKHKRKNNIFKMKVRSRKIKTIDFDIYNEIIGHIFPIDKPSFYYGTKSYIKLSTEELIKLRNVCMLELMAGAGLRVGEVLGLKIEDLSELNKGKIRIKRRTNNTNNALAKSGDGEVYVCDRIAKDLMILMIQTLNFFYSEYVFVTYQGKNKGCALKVSAVEKMFINFTNYLRKRHLINEEENVHPHQLRHMFASMVQEIGQNLFDTKELLRHKSISSTQIYAHISEEHRKKIINRIGEIINI